MRDQQKTGALVSTDAKVLAAIAKSKKASINAAAKVCGVTQPSATSSLIRLEKRLGARLVERRQGLTPEGERALRHVRTMLRAEKKLFDEFKGEQ